MGANGQRMKFGKTLSDANVAELSAVSGFTPDQVRDWHTGFLVSILYMLLIYTFHIQYSSRLFDDK
jgi:hypothetical protein